MLERPQDLALEDPRDDAPVLVNETERERDLPADRVVKYQTEDRGKHERYDQRDEDRRAIPHPLTQVLAGDEQRRGHAISPAGPSP